MAADMAADMAEDTAADMAAMTGPGALPVPAEEPAAEPGPLQPVEALRRIAFLLERAHEPTYRVRAFRRAADTVAALASGELVDRYGAGTLAELPGVGAVTAQVITEALAGEVPVYLRRLEATGGRPVAEGGAELRAVLVGDCHVHSDWSDGGSPIREMAQAAQAIGHDYIVLTDHSPRLTVARGLSPERLREQLKVVAGLNEEFAAHHADRAAAGRQSDRPPDRRPVFRILTGIECDILDDGTLDQEPGLLAELDVVVASVHSKLRMPTAEMTPRLVAAIANPHTDVLGHCTGRNVSNQGRSGRTRPESDFDADIVFAACRQFDVAVEVNCRPERLDPPKRLLRLAVEAGCKVSIDTDAHAPGQLDWQPYGCERAAACGVPAGQIINSWDADRLVGWTAERVAQRPAAP